MGKKTNDEMISQFPRGGEKKERQDEKEGTELLQFKKNK